ncbi:M48 family metallopeptidase [Deinococcus cellulosilyticus]|nr:M48 family metallopeptidase [Deinococcus cellulosilyticus]
MSPQRHRPYLHQVLVFVAGVYLLAWCGALLLVVVPVVEWISTSTLTPVQVLQMGSGMLLLWITFPRHRPFQPPGPQLHLRDHPRLQALLSEIAEQTHQPLPDEVYLMLDNNAWVQESTFLGFQGKRRMGLGLSLMQQLTVEEFRAVLAHEFGHYHAGDTRMVHLVHGARHAILRILHAQNEGHTPMLHRPFLWYGRLFLQMTQRMSRRQEYAADRIAAQLTSPEIMVQALKKVHDLGATFEAYWQIEVIPVLNLGYQPPILQGYQHYLQGSGLQHHLQDLSEEPEDPYDTHPSFVCRAEALRNLPPTHLKDLTPAALTLLEHPEVLETLVLQHFGGEDASRFQAILWTEVGEKVWVKIWQEQLSLYQGAFWDLTLRTLAGRLDQYGVKHQLLHKLQPWNEPEDEQAWHNLRVQVLLALHRQGWTVQTLPGDPVVCQKQDCSLRVFEDVWNMRSGQLLPAHWLKDLWNAGVDVDAPLTTSKAFMA